MKVYVQLCSRCTVIGTYSLDYWQGASWTTWVADFDCRQGQEPWMLTLTLGHNKAPIQWGLGVKWPVCERDLLHQYTARVKNTWSDTSIPPYLFVAQCLINPLTPNDHYSGHNAPLTSKRCILYIYSTNIGTEYFKHGIYSPFFFLFKMQLV